MGIINFPLGTKRPGKKGCQPGQPQPAKRKSNGGHKIEVLALTFDWKILNRFDNFSSSTPILLSCRRF